MLNILIAKNWGSKIGKNEIKDGIDIMEAFTSNNQIFKINRLK